MSGMTHQDNLSYVGGSDVWLEMFAAVSGILKSTRSIVIYFFSDVFPHFFRCLVAVQEGGICYLLNF